MGSLDLARFQPLLHAARARGLDTAAVFDVDGTILAGGSGMDEIDARAIAAVISNSQESVDLLTRLLDGELVALELDTRTLLLGIAAQCVFVVAIPNTPAVPDAFEVFRDGVALVISEARADFSGARALRAGSGGSSSGPAELPVVEWGVTIRRKPS